MPVAAGGKVWAGAAEAARIVCSYKLRVMDQSCFTRFTGRRSSNFMQPSLEDEVKVTWAWLEHEEGMWQPAVPSECWTKHIMAQNPDAYAVSHLCILALNWPWFLLHICPQQLSESLNARITAVINTAFQTRAMVLPMGSLCNVLSGTKNMQREHFASWRFQLGLTARCWLTVRVYTVALLCSNAVSAAAWEAQPSAWPQIQVRPGLCHPRWPFFLGSANPVAFDQRPAWSKSCFPVPVGEEAEKTLKWCQNVRWRFLSVLFLSNILILSSFLT